MRRAREIGPIGRAAWDRGYVVVRRIAGEQRIATRRFLGSAASFSTVDTPVPVLGAVEAAEAANAKLAAAEAANAGLAATSAAQSSYNASVAWTVAAYGATGLGTLIVLGVGAFLLGEHVVSVVVVQIVLLVVGFLPALEVMHRVLRWLARRAAVAGKTPKSTDNAAVVLPFLPPIGMAVVSWLIVTQ